MDIASTRAPRVVAAPIQKTSPTPIKIPVRAANGLGRDSFALSAPSSQPSPIARAVTPHVTTPLRQGNQLEFFIDGKQAFPEIHKAIDSAKERLDLEFFAIHDDPTGHKIAEKLIAKAKSGVQVNLLIDYLNYYKSKELMHELEEGGVRVKPFTDGHAVPALHVNSITDHRKVLLVDGKMALSGGMNLGEPYEKYWHDTMFKLEGPTVQDYYRYFQQNWALSDGPTLKPVQIDTTVKGKMATQVAVTAPEDQEIRLSTLAAYHAATKSIVAQSPYFIDDEVIDALTKAAERGVAVTVVIPKVGDNPFVDVMNSDVGKAFIESGIQVLQYDTMNYAIGRHDHETDHFNHGKIAIVDGRFVLMGTANADNRSMESSREINLHVDSEAFAQEVQARYFDKDRKTKAKPFDDEGSFLFEVVKRLPSLKGVREFF